MDKIMILGANGPQVPLIINAKKMGLFTIVVSIPGNYPGFALADKVYYVDTKDKEKIYEIAKKENIKGIVTTGTDVAVKSIGFVNSKLNLQGINYESSILVTDKAKMKLKMLECGIKTANFKIVHNVNEALNAIKDIGFPVMFKCTDQAASKGIIKVNSMNEVKDSFDYSMKWTKNDYIVVEQFLDGVEIGLDGYYDSEGESIFIPHNKILLNNGIVNVPIGHSVPYSNSNLYDNVINEARKCVLAMNLNKCFFNLDIMIHNNDVYIIEIGGRTGSTGLPDMLSKYCGYNYYEKMILNCLGKKLTMIYEPQKSCAAGFIMSDRDGTVIDIKKPNFDLKDVEYTFDFSVGDKIKKFKYGSDRIGQIVCTDDTLLNAENKFSKFNKLLTDLIVLVEE